ncbi:GAF domain-containing protein [Thalassobaculum sp. OXR-137]|uniref:HWE histidine kinase domain-containing protein n=1 Tax=Thalassobaculum sp. OXR-137 TaxID=3100173 RepID=UPI002AC9D118|nr:HWE histidine kinase domain-containing protein [Thalassobaculum sp. OXR-137]WPZ33953.1 GAF domain-containing protein [Thalassobaculum sp. OXR-137]
MPSPSELPPGIDLSQCEREPIHKLGRVQFFGFLIAVSPDWTITQVSENIGTYLGLEPVDLIGLDLNSVLNREAIHNIRTRMQMLQDEDTVERLFRIRILDNLQRDFDISLHVNGATTILEFEPNSDVQQDYTAYVQPMINRVSKPQTVKEACESAAKAVRALTGFDRVMVYRLHDDESGEVVAEVRNPGSTSYLGLRYPASDIPPQARRMYLRSTLRIVSDIQAPTAAIVPENDPATGEPLDLSLSSLRAVSPVHLEYLANMGVQASMSVSIVMHGKLWGLIACHHNSPRVLSFQARSATQMFGQLFALILEKKDNEASNRDRERAQALHDALMARLATGSSISRQFQELAEMIATVIPCDGMIGWTEGAYIGFGEVPTHDEFVALLPFLTSVASGRIYATHDLPAALPEGVPVPSTAAGLLAIPVSRSTRDFIVLVRREVAKTIEWAGAPDKAVIKRDGEDRLSPRTSFEAWQEIVRGQSALWTDSDIRTAESLRVTLTEVILKMSETALAERTAANERQEILIAELNHRVRNIFNVIRGIWSQSSASSGTITGLTETVGGRIQALARAYDQVTEVDWRPASLWRLLATELAAYSGKNGQRLDLRGDDALLLPNAVSAISLVIHELTTNSIKYGALSSPAGWIAVTSTQAASGDLTVEWRELGGPQVSAPERIGFGTTIIEQSVPHELGGTTTVRFVAEGLEVDITVPARFVAGMVKTPPPVPGREQEPAPTKQTASGSALLLEDNLIIALASEEMLRNVGADHVWICSTVDQALRVIETSDIDFAVLDVNLGDRNAGDVARELSRRGIPFMFVTGYGEKSPLKQTYPHAPVLQKPFAEERLSSALAQLELRR